MSLKALIAGFATLAALTVPALAVDEFDLGGAAKGTPSTVTYKFAGADAVAVFVRGPGGKMFAKVTADDGASWVDWTAIGDLSMKGDPSCTARSAGRIDCAAIGPNNNIYWTTFDVAKVSWTGWANLGGASTSDPAIVATKEGGKTQLRIFVRGPQNHLFLNTLSGGNWSDWQDLDGVIGAKFVCSAIATLGAHCFDTSGGSVKQVTDITHKTGNDVVVEDLGGAVSGKASAVWAASALHLFVLGPNNALWIKNWDSGWSDWTQTEVTMGSAPGCAMDGSGAWCASLNGNGTVKMVHLDLGDI